jgi:hypothetical protein
MRRFPARGDGPADDGDLAPIADVVRSQISQEFQISERLDSKARNQIAIGGTWYAITQAVAGFAFRVHEPGSFWAVLVGVTAGIGGFCLVMTMIHSYRVWRLHFERDFSPEGVHQMLSDAEAGRPVEPALIRTYANTLATRRGNNAARSEAFSASTRWWLIAAAVTLLELLIALGAILFQ